MQYYMILIYNWLAILIGNIIIDFRIELTVLVQNTKDIKHVVYFEFGVPWYNSQNVFLWIHDLQN